LTGAKLVSGEQVLAGRVSELRGPESHLGVAGLSSCVAEISTPCKLKRRRRDHARRTWTADTAPDGLRQLRALGSPGRDGRRLVRAKRRALGQLREPHPLGEAGLSLASVSAESREFVALGELAASIVGRTAYLWGTRGHTGRQLVGRQHLDARDAC